MGCYCRKHYHFMAPSCKLELARFSAWLKIHNGADCGKSFEYLPACNAAFPAKSKMAARGPSMADGVFGYSSQVLLNKFFDPSTPSMRKGCDGGKITEENGGKTGGGKKIMSFLDVVS